jgi:2-octaprenyl-6-methoxyphenol hydroxylase
MTKQYVFIIMGGGAVGASAALALAQCGKTVLLIEKRKNASRFSSIHDKTLALSYASIKIYETLGIKSLFHEKAAMIKQVQVTQQGQFGSCRLDHQKQKVEALGVVVGAHDLEYALYQALEQCPAVTLLQTEKDLYPELLEDKWKIEENEAALLIASDGVNSTFRKRAFIECEEIEYGHYAIALNIRLKNMPPNVATERFLNNGAIALLPWKEGWTTCVWTLQKEEAIAMNALDDACFKVQCEKALGNAFSTIQAMGQRMMYPLKMTLAKNAFGARFLLMGNAAHTLHPIAAQGLNLSLRDIWQLRSQLKQDFLDDSEVGSQNFLEKYQRAREADQRRVIFATDKIAKIMANERFPAYWRAMGITLFDMFSVIKDPFIRYGIGCLG